MIVILMFGLAMALSLPILLVFVLPMQAVPRREITLSLYRAQLVELQQDQALGRIDEAGYQSAKLEIEHRLLAADKLPPDPKGGSGKRLLILTAIILPVGAFILYVPGSTPFLPSAPHAWVMKSQAATQQKLENLIHLLRAHLAQVPPDSVNASQGQAYLAEALTEQAGAITPEALNLFEQSLAHAPLGSPWRALDQKRINQVQAPTTP